jgi:hypothetical protein
MAQMTGGSAARARQQIAEAAIEHMYVYEIFIHRRDYDRYLLAS